MVALVGAVGIIPILSCRIWGWKKLQEGAREATCNEILSIHIKQIFDIYLVM